MTDNEFSLIARYFAPLAPQADGVVLGIGDDAALLDCPPGRTLVAATDTLVAGVHFPVDMPPAAIGHRALAVNLSDLAAMGATPAWFLLALTLPTADADWLEGFSTGLRDLARAHKLALVGGDTTRGPLTITVTALGHVAPAAALRRAGAQIGDDIYISGHPGAAAAGLRVWQAAVQEAAVLRDTFLYPVPRLALGQALTGLAHAAIDVSDGLCADLAHILTASGVGATLDVEHVPLHPAAVTALGEQTARELALTGGDDYELCFIAPPAAAAQILAAGRKAGCAVTRIGRIEEQSGLRVQLHGKPMAVPQPGYQHFTDGEQT